MPEQKDKEELIEDLETLVQEFEHHGYMNRFDCASRLQMYIERELKQT